MGVSISYDKDRRLTISGIACGCGLSHRLPTQDIYVGSGIMKNTPAYIQKRGLGTHCVLVADQTPGRSRAKRWPNCWKAKALP
jgi:hypothetical protein